MSQITEASDKMKQLIAEIDRTHEAYLAAMAAYESTIAGDTVAAGISMSINFGDVRIPVPAPDDAASLQTHTGNAINFLSSELLRLFNELTQISGAMSAYCNNAIAAVKSPGVQDSQPVVPLNPPSVGPPPVASIKSGPKTVPIT